MAAGGDRAALAQGLLGDGRLAAEHAFAGAPYDVRLAQIHAADREVNLG